MGSIEFSATLNNMDIMRVDKHAVRHSLCQVCGFFVGNGGLEGIECNGAYAKSDSLMKVSHGTRMSMEAIKREAKCEP